MRPSPLMIAGWLFLRCSLATAADNDVQIHEFSLDGVERTLAGDGPLHCPKVALVTYRGEAVRYTSPVRVNVEFRERLRKFEQVTRDTAIEVYGRAPSKIRHIGTFNCRRIRRWPNWLSEHGLGNAIDVAGFDFPALSAKRARGSELPRPLRRRFQVNIERHWSGAGGADVHSHFLHLLTERLVARKDIFRVLLGPAYPGHKNHFHFDCAPWRIVEL